MTASDLTASDWPAYLEELAVSLTHQRLCLQADELDMALDVLAFEPPHQLGALPAAYAARAREILHELDQVQALMVERRDSTARQLQVQRRMRTSTAPPSGSAYLDRRG